MQQFILNSTELNKGQQFSLNTAIIASYLYPALGGADARNEGGDAPLSPPCEPPLGRGFSTKTFWFDE